MSLPPPPPFSFFSTPFPILPLPFPTHSLFPPPLFPLLFSSLTPVAPNITNKPASPNVVINSGTTETITINYDPGNLPSMVQWSKDGQLINGSSDPRISAAPNSTSLTLTNSDPSIRGRYLVNVSNIGGSDTFQCNVKAVCKLFKNTLLMGYM